MKIVNAGKAFRVIFILIFVVLLLSGIYYQTIKRPSVVRPNSKFAGVWELQNYVDASGNQGMFYTMYNKGDGTLIVIDGGWAENEQQVRDVIYSYGNHVTAWFITHYHNDHVDAFNSIFADPQGMVIDRVYDSPIDYEYYLSVAQWWDFPDSFTRYLELTEDAGNVTHLYKDEELEIDGLNIYVFNSYFEDLIGYGDVPNNASLVFKVTGQEDSILFCADAHTDLLGDALIAEYGDRLQAKYVQTGHHGNNSFPDYFYDTVQPEIAIFDGPEWLMTGENYTAKDLAAYFEANDVEVFSYMTAPNIFEFK